MLRDKKVEKFRDKFDEFEENVRESVAEESLTYSERVHQFFTAVCTDQNNRCVSSVSGVPTRLALALPSTSFSTTTTTTTESMLEKAIKRNMTLHRDIEKCLQKDIARLCTELFPGVRHHQYSHIVDLEFRPAVDGDSTEGQKQGSSVSSNNSSHNHSKSHHINNNNKGIIHFPEMHAIAEVAPSSSQRISFINIRPGVGVASGSHIHSPQKPSKGSSSTADSNHHDHDHDHDRNHHHLVNRPSIVGDIVVVDPNVLYSLHGERYQSERHARELSIEAALLGSSSNENDSIAAIALVAAATTAASTHKSHIHHKPAFAHSGSPNSHSSPNHSNNTTPSPPKQHHHQHQHASEDSHEGPPKRNFPARGAAVVDEANSTISAKNRLFQDRQQQRGTSTIVEECEDDNSDDDDDDVVASEVYNANTGITVKTKIVPVKRVRGASSNQQSLDPVLMDQQTQLNPKSPSHASSLDGSGNSAEGKDHTKLQESSDTDDAKTFKKTPLQKQISSARVHQIKAPVAKTAEEIEAEKIKQERLDAENARNLRGGVSAWLIQLIRKKRAAQEEVSRSVQAKGVIATNKETELLNENMKDALEPQTESNELTSANKPNMYAPAVESKEVMEAVRRTKKRLKEYARSLSPARTNNDAIATIENTVDPAALGTITITGTAGHGSSSIATHSQLQSQSQSLESSAVKPVTPSASTSPRIQRRLDNNSNNSNNNNNNDNNGIRYISGGANLKGPAIFQGKTSVLFQRYPIKVVGYSMLLSS